MSSKEGCVIDRKVWNEEEVMGRATNHKTDSSAARLIALFGPWHVSVDHLGQPDQISPGCHAQEMRLEPATVTGIKCARWGLEVVPGVRIFLPGGDSRPFWIFLPLEPRNCAVF